MQSDSVEMNFLQCAIRDSDVTSWSNGFVKLTLNDVCRRFDIDIENDPKNKFFWQIQLHQKVVVTEELLCWIGYRGHTYHNKKQIVTRLLKKNPHIHYYEIPDQTDPRKSYIVMDAIHFESLLMQMRTSKVVELRNLFSLIKMILVKYCQYEKWFERNSAEMLRQQNNQLLGSVKDLKSLVVTIKKEGDERECRAEKERQLAKERERRAEVERQLAEQRERRAEEERLLAQERSRLLTAQIENNIDSLRNVIAPRVVPYPMGYGKRHRLGLFRTSVEGEWYLMRRQNETWKDSERRLYSRSMTRVHVWDNIPHAIDVGNILKKKCQLLTWYARGNLIRVPSKYRGDISEDSIRNMIDEIVFQENAAHVLANDNAHVIQGIVHQQPAARVLANDNAHLMM